MTWVSQRRDAVVTRRDTWLLSAIGMILFASGCGEGGGGGTEEDFECVTSRGALEVVVDWATTENLDLGAGNLSSCPGGDGSVDRVLAAAGAEGEDFHVRFTPPIVCGLSCGEFDAVS